MRNFITFTLLASSLCFFTVLHAEESLFSEVAMESVFEKNTTLSSSVASLGDGEKLERITGASSLMLALKFAGHTPRQVGERVTFNVEQAGWKLPVALEVEIEQDRILCEMSLIEIADNTTIDSSALLKLLEKNDAVGGYVFVYDSKSKLLQLRSSFSNRAITAKQLKANLSQIAAFAERHSELWAKLGAKSKAKAADTSSTKTTGTAAAKPVTTAPAQPAVQLSSLVGLWGATMKSGESIAIQISADTSFKLATVKSGKSSLSKGKASLSGNKLTLVGDDKVTLNCTLAQVTAAKFQLAIVDDKGTPKLTVDFAKSK